MTPEHSVWLFVRVSTDHNIELGGSRIEVKLLNVVQDVYVCRASLSDCSHRQVGCPSAFVNVSSNGDHWRTAAPIFPRRFGDHSRLHEDVTPFRFFEASPAGGHKWRRPVSADKIEACRGSWTKRWKK